MRKSPILRSLMLFEGVDFTLQDEDKPKVTLHQPIINLHVPFLPTLMSFSLVMAVADFDWYELYDIRIDLIAPDGKVMDELINWTFGEENISDVNPKILPGALLVADIKNVKLSEEGAYELAVHYDGSKIGNHIFEVYVTEE